MKTSPWIVVALAAVCALPKPSYAQDRTAAIDLARQAFEVSTAVRLLGSVANPALAGTDSLWAVAVHEIAYRLMERSDTAGAALWLRWSARQDGRWPIDRSAFPPRLIDAYDRALAQASAAYGLEGETETAWRWPTSLDLGSPGRIEIGPADSVPVLVTVPGYGSVQSGGSMQLAPGTYQFVAYADDRDPASVEREVLPGVATILRFDLPPRLPSSVVQRSASSLVSIRWTLGGQQVCTNGFVAGPNGLVLTSSSALPPPGGLEVVTTTRIYKDVSVVTRDAENDVASLKLNDPLARPLAAAGPPTAGMYAWLIFRNSCNAPILTRVRLTGPLADRRFSPALVGDFRGAPLIDRDGSLLGMVIGADRFLPMPATPPAGR